jgi:hypothetical protein
LAVSLCFLKYCKKPFKQKCLKAILFLSLPTFDYNLRGNLVKAC